MDSGRRGARPGGFPQAPVPAGLLRALGVSSHTGLLDRCFSDRTTTGSTEWQRHYATARALLGEEGGLTEVLPGVLVHGCDVGAWINRQREHAVWTKLLPEQRQRLEALGLTPLPAVPARKTASTAGAFERGVLALKQYRARTGTVTVPRAHIETVVIDGQEHPIKLGVFLTNSKTRRAKLAADKLAVLAALGLDWAA
ncbi:helicase associated domain-containing protein [Streptomyces glycanivorans]|uniref:Helicase associated domain-containing protein n=1 Tax=Streptomyces glycanivorans TaxID=3033808 RepID=A0ABY9JRP2_9ACTN|nr:helicase associated domain-containing protein [Streptomyces sp. Alt3]WLQ69313.1 helicase associated domain-containing protein [Streptomyces sp. Alt3]